MLDTQDEMEASALPAGLAHTKVSMAPARARLVHKANFQSWQDKPLPTRALNARRSQTHQQEAAVSSTARATWDTQGQTEENAGHAEQGHTRTRMGRQSAPLAPGASILAFLYRRPAKSVYHARLELITNCSDPTPVHPAFHVQWEHTLR